MITEINAEQEKSDRLTVTKLNTVKQYNKQDHKSELMTEKYLLLPLNPQKLTPVQTVIQRMSEKHLDNQMVYLLAPHASVLQTNTTKFKQDFIGPLFIDTAFDKTHYRLKDTTGLPLDGTYHMNLIKKGSARTPLGIVDQFDTYETALKNTLLNKFAIETLNNKLQEVTLQDDSKEINYLPGTIMDYVPMHG